MKNNYKYLDIACEYEEENAYSINAKVHVVIKELKATGFQLLFVQHGSVSRKGTVKKEIRK